LDVQQRRHYRDQRNDEDVCEIKNLLKSLCGNRVLLDLRSSGHEAYKATDNRRDQKLDYRNHYDGSPGARGELTCPSHRGFALQPFDQHDWSIQRVTNPNDDSRYDQANDAEKKPERYPDHSLEKRTPALMQNRKRLAQLDGS